MMLDNAGAGYLRQRDSATDVANCMNGAGIDNQSTGSFTFQPVRRSSSDGPPTFVTNQGTLDPIAPPAASTFIQAAFTQTGTGSTSVAGGFDSSWTGTATISGSMTAAAGTTLMFAGPRRLDASSSITGAGTVVLEKAVTVAGTYDVTGTTEAYSSNGVTLHCADHRPGQSWRCRSATLDIATDQSFSFTSLTVNGTLSGAGGRPDGHRLNDLDGGTISGFGTLTIASGATLSLGYLRVRSTACAGQRGRGDPVGSRNYGGLVLGERCDIDNEPRGQLHVPDLRLDHRATARRRSSLTRGA